MKKLIKNSGFIPGEFYTITMVSNVFKEVENEIVQATAGFLKSGEVVMFIARFKMDFKFYNSPHEINYCLYKGKPIYLLNNVEHFKIKHNLF